MLLDKWNRRGLLGEGEQEIVNIKRFQEALFGEKKQFAGSIEELGIGMPTKTVLYQYSTHSSPLIALSYAIAVPRKKHALKSYVAGTFVVVDHATQDLTAKSIVCQTSAASTEKPSDPIIKENIIQCGEGTEPLQLTFSGQPCCPQSIPVDPDVVLAHQALNQALAKRYAEARQSGARIQNPQLRSRVLSAIDPKAK